jgi:hypothetical protein
LFRQFNAIGYFVAILVALECVVANCDFFGVGKKVLVRILADRQFM